MGCPRCASEREAKRGFCRDCFEVFRKPGVLRRVARALGFAGRTASRAGVVVSRQPESLSFELHDPQTGRTRRYGDPSELPESVREALEEAARQGGSVTETRVESHEEFRVSDGAGNERVYRSLDDMPPEIRSLLRKARAKRS